MSRKSREQKIFLIGDSKVCAVCNETKHISLFRKAKGMYCGCDSYCKLCRTKDAQRRREEQCSTTLGHLKFVCQRTKYSATANSLDFNLDVSFLIDLYTSQKGLCALSKEVLTTGQGQGRKDTALSVDRIDSSKGYTKDNVQLVCYIVNIMKNTMTKDELLSWCQKIIKTNN